MPSALPDGEPAPSDGALPGTAVEGLGRNPFGFYVHVPYCATRCGYCDFNTYTAEELQGTSRATWRLTATQEVQFARRVLGDRTPPVETVFVGGGTPTLLPAADLGAVLGVIREEFGLAPDAEVTTEANPESVDARSLSQLRELGFTRISFGMQSASPHVLQVLERRHTAGRVPQVVHLARAAGFEQVSVDLIYGTPGESLQDWSDTLDAALAVSPDHVSAYALIVEDGTRLAGRVRRGEVEAPDDDAMADAYLLADERFAAAGFEWYELSNWARDGARCRHNVGYWRDGDWWGVGPGAHSHVNGVRWWNVKHPSAWAARLDAGVSPAHARELVGRADRRVERVLLGTRLREGQPLTDLSDSGRSAALRLVRDGLLDASAHDNGRAVLTLRGRLLADAVVRDLVD